MKFDFCRLAAEQPLRIVSNLLYNISTSILFHLLDQARCIQDMHFMLQKAVVQRMAASSGLKRYGRLSVMLQASCEVESQFEIGPGAFKPASKVDSVSRIGSIKALFSEIYRNPTLLFYPGFRSLTRAAGG